MPKRKIKPYTHFTKAEDDFLKENYLEYNYHELALKMGRSKYGVVHRLRHLGLKVPDEIMEIRKQDSYFKKGHEPANKGMKGFCAPGCEKGWFKKGGDPANTLYDGAITIRHNHIDRASKPYMYIRIAEAKWIPYHQYLWRKHFGEIPLKHIVVFKDGNSMNCIIENLELISMKENLRRNHNAEKAAKTREKNPATIAHYMAFGDKELQQELIKNYPHLIELKRQQLKLKRELKHANTRRIKKQTMDV